MFYLNLYYILNKIYNEKYKKYMKRNIPLPRIFIRILPWVIPLELCTPIKDKDKKNSFKGKLLGLHTLEKKSSTIICHEMSK